MYRIKYLKYKHKYIDLKIQLGGECNPLPTMSDDEPITLEAYNTRGPNDRITINGRCYFVNELFNWIIRDNHNEAPFRSIVSSDDKWRLIDAYNILHPQAPHITGIPAYVEQLIHEDWQNAPIPILRPRYIADVDGELVLTLPSSVVSIDDNEYADSTLAQVRIPSSVVSIGNSAFANNLISDLKLPRSVAEIGDNAFANNRFLRNVTMPSRFSSIASKQRIFGDRWPEIHFIYF